VPGRGAMEGSRSFMGFGLWRAIGGLKLVWL
jgi:hypothetical protein